MLRRILARGQQSSEPILPLSGDKVGASQLSVQPWLPPLQGLTDAMNRLDRGVSPTRLHNGSRDVSRLRYGTCFSALPGLFIAPGRCTPGLWRTARRSSRAEAWVY